MKSKILLVVEGELEEPRILGSASHGLLSLVGADYEIVPFANPIYELYEAYKNGEYDDLVSYLRYEKGLHIDSNVLSKNAFSAIYLIFDLTIRFAVFCANIPGTVSIAISVPSPRTESGREFISRIFLPLISVPILLLSLSNKLIIFNP